LKYPKAGWVLVKWDYHWLTLLEVIIFNDLSLKCQNKCKEGGKFHPKPNPFVKLLPMS